MDGLPDCKIPKEIRYNYGSRNENGPTCASANTAGSSRYQSARLVAGVAGSVAMKARAKKRVAWIACGTWACYILSYSMNSALGGYWVRPEMDGHDRYRFGLAMPTAILWQPRWRHFAVGHADSLGIAYAALIWVDRKFVHRSIYISAPDGFERLNALSRKQWHPAFREMYDMSRTNQQANGAAHRGQSIRPEPNQMSAPAGSGR